MPNTQDSDKKNISSFSWSKLKKPFACLAPMEGYTDSSFRQLIKSVAPNTICYTEFTSADGLKYGSSKGFKKIEFQESERPLIAQIFGHHPDIFAEVTPLVENMDVDGIDINMGCPSGKVVNSCNGSALFQHPELAQEIVKATVQSTSLEVSVKMRIGFGQYDPELFKKFILGIQASGAKHLAIHGRTTKQKYTGLADWEPIYLAKEILDIPVTGNGDIKSLEDFKTKLKNLDGIMIGRATFGNPWLMGEIDAYLQGKTFDYPKNFSKKIPFIIKQAQLAIDFKGEKRAMHEIRKHLANYIKGIPGASNYRFRLVRVENLEEIKTILEEIRLSLKN